MLGQCLTQCIFDMPGQLPNELPRWWDGLVDVRQQHRGRRVGLERNAARQHLVGDHCQRIAVGRRSDGVAGALLGGHVLGGPEHGAAGGQAACRSRHLREAEVGQHRGPVTVQENVRGLDVAMQDALAVGVVQGAGDRAHDLDHLFEINRVAEAVREGPALYQLEHEVGDTALLAVIEDVEDVGVLEAGH